MSTEKIAEKVKRTPVTAAAVKKAVEKTQKRIYVGPNSVKLTKYLVLESDYPTHIQELAQDCPAIDKLFVPISKIQETEQRIVQKGTLENRYYKEADEFLKGAK